MNDVEQSGSIRKDDGPVARIILARPHERNALNPQLAASITTAAREIAADQNIRVVVLESEGDHFSAGADLQWMRDSLHLSLEENIADAERFSEMYEALNTLPQAVICKVQGAAIGGGAGLVAVADIAVAADNAVFGFTETRLGILPAMIGPYVVAKIGYSAARAAFVRADRFGAPAAAIMGLIHEIAAPADLDTVCSAIIADVLQNAPGAVAAAKVFLREITTVDIATTYEKLAARESTRRLHASKTIAVRRQTPEAQSGIRAFLERTRAPWSQ